MQNHGIYAISVILKVTLKRKKESFQTGRLRNSTQPFVANNYQEARCRVSINSRLGKYFFSDNFASIRDTNRKASLPSKKIYEKKFTETI
jgi:hypothetical protein